MNDDYQPGAVPPSVDPLSDPAEAELQKRLAEARALIDCTPISGETLDRFLDDDVAAALALLQQHERSYFWRLRQKLDSAAKSSGRTILRDLDRAVSSASKELAESEQKIAEKVRFVALGTDLLELWHDQANVAWCWPKEHGAGCCWRIQAKETRIYLLRAYGQRHQVTLDDGRKVPAAPSKQGVSEAMDMLEAIAHGGPRRPEPALRIGGDGERLVIDLCNDDYTVAVVTPQGWQVVKPSPIPMRRVDGMLPLPLPVIDAGDALSELRTLLGLDDEPILWAQWRGFQFSCLRPSPPYFAGGMFEEQGRGKTTSARVLRQPFDAHEIERQPKPKSADDLYVCCYGQWFPCFDNLSTLTQEYSDAFCCILTGMTHAKRELFTDFGVIRLKLARPLVITAIVDVVSAPDLLDRTLVMRLPEILNVMDDDELLAATGALAPRILGQLLDAAALALRDFAKTKLTERVRMVGPTRWVEAGSPALGLAPGEFTHAYLASIERAHEIALESSPIGAALQRMLENRDSLARLEKNYAGPLGYLGTAEQLLRELNEHMGGEPRPDHWPKDATRLSGQLRRIAPPLRKLGYRVVFRGAGRDKDKHREIVIETKFSYAHKNKAAQKQRPERSQRPHGMAYIPPSGPNGDAGDAISPTSRNKEQSRVRAEAVGDVRELCKRAAEVKGDDAVAAIVRRCLRFGGRVSDATPAEAEQIRVAVEQLLNGAD